MVSFPLTVVSRDKDALWSVGKSCLELGEPHHGPEFQIQKPNTLNIMENTEYLLSSS